MPVVKEIQAQIITLEIKAPITVGQQLFFHCQSQKTICKVKKIHKIFSKSGDITKNNSV
jgi:translation elongation factor EF-1alpha